MFQVRTLALIDKDTFDKDQLLLTRDTTRNWTDERDGQTCDFQQRWTYERKGRATLIMCMVSLELLETATEVSLNFILHRFIKTLLVWRVARCVYCINITPLSHRCRYISPLPALPTISRYLVIRKSYPFHILYSFVLIYCHLLDIYSAIQFGEGA